MCVCIFLYFTEILCEILTTMETIKQQQQMILLQLQTKYPHPVKVPELSGFPLTSLNELVKLEERIAAQVEYRRKLACFTMSSFELIFAFLLLKPVAYTTVIIYLC